MLGRRGQQSADRDTASAMTRLVRGLRVWLVPLVLTAGLLVLAGGAWGAIADRRGRPMRLLGIDFSRLSEDVGHA